MSESRKTAISWVESGDISIRGYSVEDLIGNVSFGAGAYLVLRGEMPTENQARLFDAILVSVIDHGIRPPSTISAITAANTGSGLSAAVASGILAINKYHGGAIEDAMRSLAEAVTHSETNGTSALDSAKFLVAKYKADGARISGFGHRHHATDPRTSRLFQLASEMSLSGKFVAQALAIEVALAESSGRKLPVNADGAIAALLCELDFPPAAANGVFMIARVPGLVAHVIEEQARNPPMRTVDVDNYEYDGETNRSLPAK